MEFEWNERKRKSNVRKHGFDFIDAAKVFEGDTLTVLDDRGDYGERRFVSIGLLKSVVVVSSHTERNDVIRIISMRKATRNEEIHYFTQVGNELETDPDNDGQKH
jgi:uncharacterized DUF497 family protein